MQLTGGSNKKYIKDWNRCVGKILHSNKLLFSFEFWFFPGFLTCVRFLFLRFPRSRFLFRGFAACSRSDSDCVPPVPISDDVYQIDHRGQNKKGGAEARNYSDEEDQAE